MRGGEGLFNQDYLFVFFKMAQTLFDVKLLHIQ